MFYHIFLFIDTFPSLLRPIIMMYKDTNDIQTITKINIFETT